MATYGQSSRNRPALYKPTDFGSQQKRLSSVSGSSGSEVKKEEEKVTIKIQQRPHTAPADEKPPVMDNKPVKILKESPVAVEKSNGSKKVDELPGVIGSRDLDKIKQLKEFMAAQEDKKPSAKVGESKPPGKPTVSPVTKLQPQALMKIPTTGVNPALMSGGKHPMSSGKPTHSKAGSFAGKSPIGIGGKTSSPSSGKLFKENKDPEGLKDSSKEKALRDSKDGKNKNGRPTSNRNQKTPNKPGGGPPSRGKPNDKPIGKQNKNESGTNIKTAGKAAQSAHNGGTRPKIVTSKAPVNNARLPNQNRPYDRTAPSSVNSYYSQAQANKIAGYPQANSTQGNKIAGLADPPPWMNLPYGINGLNLNKQSILGQPQGARPDQPQQAARIAQQAQGLRLDYSQKNAAAGQEKIADPKAATPGVAAAKKNVVTVAATKDKSEQKKSLDFVKSFFDNDPEVQYNRKLHAETRTTVKPPVTAASEAPGGISTKEEAPVGSRLQQHVTSQIGNHANNQINTLGNSQLHSHVNNSRVAGHVNSQINSQISSQINSHVNSLVNNHGNSQSFVHPSSHLQSSHIAGTHLAGNHVAGTHIPGSIATTYSSVYHHSNLSNMAAHNNLHQSAQQHFQGSSGGTAVHMGATPNLHATISHPQSLQHGQQAYDLYSNQMNPLLSASSYHDAVSSFPTSAMSHNSGGSVNPGFPSYSGYFPADGSHMSHVHHTQQQIDPNTVADIMQNQVKCYSEK